ncbi:voltage-gated sensitive sodium channel-like protein, partial [Leptotrombidium deliense]
VVVNALIQAIPAIFNVLLVCLILWLIFAIMGVQFFSGKFGYCRHNTTQRMMNASEVENKTICETKFNDTAYWHVPPINFDNVFNGYLALLQVATFKGWTQIIFNAVDSVGYELQPKEESNLVMYAYFVSFVFCGSFFTLNLFIGVIIDNFNEQKKRAGGALEMLMTKEQKKYYSAMKKMGKRKPIKAIPRPRFKLQAFLFDVTTNKKFDMTIMVIILLNMLVMCLDKYQADKQYSDTLETLNLVFIGIFTVECLLKLFALRWYYFKEPWNIFDFVIVILSITGSILKEWVSRYFVSPTMLRVIRVVKIGRVLRLVKSARGIRTLLFALAMSLPALFNICLLLFLITFIYAIFGMSFFMNVKKRGYIDDTFNFGTFFKSFVVLFPMCTSSGWSDVLAAISDETNCTAPNGENLGDCGNRSLATGYLVTYLIITFFVIINMYIAVILENYSQAKDDVQQGLTNDDYDMFYEVWSRYDPTGTRFIHVSLISDLLDALEVPLKIAKPNKYIIVSMDIPICAGDLVYCVEVLDALTKYFFANKGIIVEENTQKLLPLYDDREHISSTLWRQREVYCALLLQKAWNKWKSCLTR